MAGEEFRPFHLRGGRFRGSESGDAGFPLEAVAELARYERLLIQVARGLWKASNTSRVRAPKNFEDSLRLRLTAVEEGSVVPVLQRRQSPRTQLFDPDGWLESSQAKIADAVAAVAAGEPVPTNFPPDAMASLVNFGSGLRSEEELVMPRRNAPEVVYTQRARQHLLGLMSPEDVEISDELVGRLVMVHADRQVFEFKHRTGYVVDGKFSQRGVFSSLKGPMNPSQVAPFVRIVCTFRTDGSGRVTSIQDVDDVDEVLGADDPLAQSLRGLLELSDGWAEGDGAAPAIEAVEWVRDFAAELADGLAVDLSVFPTLAGGLLVERQIGRRRWSLEFDEAGDVSIVIADEDGATTTEPSDVGEAASSLVSFVA